MKIKITILTFTILLSLMLASCAPSQKPTQDNALNLEESSSGQDGFIKPDISGEIISIEGNNISLKVINMPNSRGNSGDRNPDSFYQEDRGNMQNSLTPGPGQSIRPRRTPVPGQTTRQRRTLVPGQTIRPRQTPLPGQTMRPGQGGWQVQYTGETKTITIPDGVVINTQGRGQDQINNETLGVKDLKIGNVIQVWYQDKIKEVVSRVRVNTFRQP